MINVQWEEVEALRRPRERERLRSLTVEDSLRQFNETMELADRLQKGANLERLRRWEIEQLVRWREKMDTLGTAGR